jgi:hypothetical protein
LKESEEIVNKVANSGLITIDLEDFYPKQHVAEIDIKDFLYEGIILKEKEFRKSLDEINWEAFKGQIIAVFCSEEAIIPKWAYMLVSMHAAPFTDQIYFGTREFALDEAYLHNLDKNIDASSYTNKRVVIKGCSDREVSERVYLSITNRLIPVVKSLMYGEPCSTVPIYKKKP